MPHGETAIAALRIENPDPRTFWTPERLRLLFFGLWAAAVYTLLVAFAQIGAGEFGLDAHAYWASWTNHLYAIAPEHRDAYLYSPVFAEAVWPLTRLPWPLFCGVWIGAVAAIYVWLLAPVRMRWRIPLLVLCSLDIVTGNVWSLFAMVLVLGFRFPGAWAFPIVTKVTPVVGPVWFAARRQWRSLMLALGVTGGLTATSIAAAPRLWRRWLTLLLHPNSLRHSGKSLAPVLYLHGALYVAVALALAVAIAHYAARTRRPWLLAVAMIFANPVFTVNSFSMLAAIPRLRRSQL
jgi:hypothetical protein